jgi:hypothetical protein
LSVKTPAPLLASELPAPETAPAIEEAAPALTSRLLKLATDETNVTFPLPALSLSADAALVVALPTAYLKMAAPFDELLP